MPMRVLVAMAPNPAIAVGLSTSRGGNPELKKQAYSNGPMGTISKGIKYYAFSTERHGVYERDGINISCCECYGTTYIFRRDVRVEVIDSDCSNVLDDSIERSRER
jgi:hypothetical protein